MIPEDQRTAPGSARITNGKIKSSCRSFFSKHIAMARSKQTYQKREKEVKRMKQRKEKEERAEQRKANKNKGKSLEEMMVYLDVNGNLTASKPLN